MDVLEQYYIDTTLTANNIAACVQFNLFHQNLIRMFWSVFCQHSTLYKKWKRVFYPQFVSVFSWSKWMLWEDMVGNKPHLWSLYHSSTSHLCFAAANEPHIHSRVEIPAPVSIFNPKICILCFADLVHQKWRCPMGCSGRTWWPTNLICQACLPPLLPPSSESCKGRGDFQRWKLLHKKGSVQICLSYLSKKVKMHVEKRVIFLFWFLSCVQGKGSDEEGGKFTTIWRGRRLYWPILRFHLSRVCSRRHGPRHGDEQVFY